ncbi:hypothetical protein GCM10009809_40270 [Isoptericola hypogeus]|uniref:Serine protease, subtilisin family n=1 Tax=Isoptericola hypogeus TaxID=300179 RepID=A0ABN2JVU9_9MICO
MISHGRRRSAVRLDRIRAATLAVSLAAGTLVGVSLESAPAAANAVTASAAPGLGNGFHVDHTAQVTLVSGDTVIVGPDDAPRVEPGPGRERVSFDIQDTGDGLTVVPADAADLLAAGRLDHRLFDIAYLIDEGYDDDHRDELPLLVEGSRADVRGLAASPGTDLRTTLPAGRVSALSQDRRGPRRADLWSALTAEAGAGPKVATALPEGITKVWLDGTVEATLDQSVPQIGAPEAWDAGYDGEGVTIAVLDTGIDSTHPDLANKVVQEKVFSQEPTSGQFTVDQLPQPVGFFGMVGGKVVPKSGSAAPLVNVGRACTTTLGDELLADPAGKTALVVRDQGGCPLAEQYDAVAEAGATGVVVHNDEPGHFVGQVLDAQHRNAIWAAGVSDRSGADLIGLLDADQEVVLDFTANAFAGDLVGHGTHVAGTIVGSGAASGGRYKGVAPGADLMNAKVLNDKGSALESWVLAGMEWAAANGADIINMSLGGAPSDGTDPLSQAVNRISAEQDVLFVISAGNSGDAPQTIGSPGAADAALTVGAVDKSDGLATFSSRGPRLGDFAVKPDVTAPGVDIVAPRAAGTDLLGHVEPLDEHYMGANGTSMATPHVAGAAALLQQARPELRGTALKNALTSTAVDGGYAPSEQGTGRIDVARAFRQGVYATTSLNFGSLTGTDATTARDLVYTNDTDAVVDLDLSVDPASGLQLSATRVQVPAHGSASVAVSVSPADLDLGPGGGVVTGASDQVSLRTAAGFNRTRTIDPMTENWDAEWAVSDEHSGNTVGARLGDTALSADGRQLFQFGPAFLSDEFITAAVDTVTGEQLWVAHHPVAASSGTRGAGIAASPDGSTVFVSGEQTDPATNRTSIVTLAYNNVPPASPTDPELGEELWRAVQPDISVVGLNPGGGGSIAVTPDGSTVVLAATELGDDHDTTMTTIAYDAGTGKQDWIARRGDPGLMTTGIDLSIDPEGKYAYVSGFTQLRHREVAVNPVTVAYELTGVRRGEERWVSRRDSVAVNFQAWHNSVSSDGDRIFVTGTVLEDSEEFDERMQTQALDAATGELVWTSTFGAADHDWEPGHTGPARGTDQAETEAIAVSPNNDLMFVTGSHCEGSSCAGDFGLVTVAYRQSTGEEVWSAIHAISHPPIPRTLDTSVAVSPDGTGVYVSGVCCATRKSTLPREQVTFAYDAATGERTALARENFQGGSIENAGEILVSPHDGTVYATGQATFAYTSGKPTTWLIRAYEAPVTFASLRARVDALAEEHKVTLPGQVQLLVRLRQAETHTQDGSPPLAIAALQKFASIARSTKFVPDSDARATLTGDLERLMDRLRG